MMNTPHPLDRPVWSALTSGWSPYAQGDALALRLDPNFGPFGAAADLSDASVDALEAFVPIGGELWIAEAGALPTPRKARLLRTARLSQLVADEIHPAKAPIAFEQLQETDAAQIRALATLTKPGPFAASTHRIGNFIGIRRDGKLIAMAGERMQVNGFGEVSGVCTHPDYRGHGYAGALIRGIATRILARGTLPFLHSYADNAGAIALYESIGFRFRAHIDVAIWTRD